MIYYNNNLVRVVGHIVCVHVRIVRVVRFDVRIVRINVRVDVRVVRINVRVDVRVVRIEIALFSGLRNYVITICKDHHATCHTAIRSMESLK